MIKVLEEIAVEKLKSFAETFLKSTPGLRSNRLSWLRGWRSNRSGLRRGETSGLVTRENNFLRAYQHVKPRAKSVLRWFLAIHIYYLIPFKNVALAWVLSIILGHPDKYVHAWRWIMTKTTAFASLFTLLLATSCAHQKYVYVPYDYQGALSGVIDQNHPAQVLPALPADPTAEEPPPWEEAQHQAWEAKMQAFQQAKIARAQARDRKGLYGVTSHTCTSTPIYSMYGGVVRMDVQCH